MKFQLDVVADHLPDATAEPARHSLGLAREMLRHSQSEARRSAWELRSQALERGGLDGAFAELAAQMSDGKKRRVEVTLSGPARRLATTTEFHLLRIGQEAITNAVKHGEARHITVALDYASDGVSLQVSDDGRGFDSAAPPARPGAHFGLMGMRERAGKIGALLAIESQPGAGASVRCILARPENSPA